MITFSSAPLLLLIGLSILFSIGLFVLTWGNRLPGKGVWMVWIGILILLGIISVTSGLIPGVSFTRSVWLAGWIWPREAVGALTLGIYQNNLGLVMGALATGLCGLVLLNRVYFLNDIYSEKIFAALVISSCGVVLSWNSITPWLVLMGQLLALIGGFLSYGSNWELPKEADTAVKFLRVRVAGFLLTFFGACILVASRHALLFDSLELWVSQVSSVESTWIGSVLLVTGIFIQMVCFPLLGWAVSSSQNSSPETPIQSLLTQIFPAWAAFSMLLRLHSQLESLGLFPAFGWVALICSALTSLSGLFQTQWKTGLRIWLASGFSLSIAGLAFSGPSTGFGLLLGISLGVFVLSGVGFEVDMGKETQIQAKTRTPSHRLFGLKIFAVSSLFLANGGIGFISATSGTQWLLKSMESPRTIPFLLFVLFLSGLLGWKLLWKVLKVKHAKPVPLIAFLTPSIGILLGLSLFWTGSITGGLFADLPDQIFVSGFDKFFGPSHLQHVELESTIYSLGLFWGNIFLALLAAFWLSGRKEDKWKTFAQGHPRISHFLENGYGVDGMLRLVIEAVRTLGKGLEATLDFRIWMDWIPRGLWVSIQFFSNALNRTGEAVTFALARGMQWSVEFPARGLQFIQNGDLRWYFVFVFGFSFAVILYYLYFLKGI